MLPTHSRYYIRGVTTIGVKSRPTAQSRGVAPYRADPDNRYNTAKRNAPYKARFLPYKAHFILCTPRLVVR
jgi:hypothetical protein